MKSELIAHLTADFGGHAMLTPKRSAEIHVLGASSCLVMTGDVLSFASVTSDSFQAKSTGVLFWPTQCEMCRCVWHSVELFGCYCSAQRVLCESCPAHQVLVVSSIVVSAS